MRSVAKGRSAEAIKIADEVWIATALLHREHPERQDFTVQEIIRRAEQENISGVSRKGTAVHAYLHCVANRPPKPNAYRMLYATGKSTRRLYRSGDPVHPERSAKVCPRSEDIPERYKSLLDWYEGQYAQQGVRKKPMDPLLALRGVGSDIWKDIDADEYVRELREDWE